MTIVRSFLFGAGLVLLPLSMHAQQIVEAEYYFDNDPGPGNGLVIPVTAASSIDLELTIDLSVLALGIHTLYVRVKDDSGRWSGYLARPVFVAPAIPADTAPQITEAEYYFDNDPGPGNGLSIPVTADDSIDFELIIDLTELAIGFHTLYARVKDDANHWSGYLSRPVYVAPRIPGDPDRLIVGTEYFWDEDPGHGQGFPLTAMGDEAIITSGIFGLSAGIHIFYVRTQDNDGQWSSTLARPVYLTPYSGAEPSKIVAIHQAIVSDGNRTELPSYSDFTSAGNVDLIYRINLAGETLGSSFTTHIWVEDSGGNLSSEAVAIVTFFDDPPTAIDDEVLAYSGYPVVVQPLANDLTEDGDSLSILYVRYAGSGGVEVTSPTSLLYNSLADFEGLDTLEYVIADESGQRDSALVIMTVKLPIAPQFLDLGSLLLIEDEPYQAPIDSFFSFVEDTDTPDSLLIWEALSGRNVDATVIADTLYIMPNENWFGRDTVRLIASDGILADTAEIELVISPVNDVPESFALLSPGNNTVVDLDSALATFIWRSSHDIDGDSLTYSLRISHDLWDTLIATVDTHVTVDMSPPFMPDTSYLWIVEVTDGVANRLADSAFTFRMPVPLAIDEGGQLPLQFVLHQNYPNPFNPKTQIEFDLPHQAKVSLKIYDIMGREVRAVVDDVLSLGYYKVIWEGRDQRGKQVPSGVYIARLVTTNYTKSIKMVLLK